MGRNPRIEYSGAIYHVIQRGNNREYIFRNEIHKGYLVKIIRETKAKMPFNIFAYVFMDNHYHILLQTFETPLSILMHRINNRYSKYYNYKAKRTGHVFENRYKSILVQDKSYLLALIKYIHSNPVKANMCLTMDAYKWSSDVFYRRNMNNIVDIGFALDMLSLDRISAIRKYIEFMDDMDEEKTDEEKAGCPEAPSEEAAATLVGDDEIEKSAVLGDNAFKARMLRKPMLCAPPLDSILKGTCNDDMDLYNEIKRGGRTRSLTEYKLEYIVMARGHGYSYSQIGENIGVSDNAVLMLLKRKGIFSV